jgi:hypothetical protein
MEGVASKQIAEETLRRRLRELRSELNLGEAELQALVRRQQELRDTVLRISGAIRVIEELLGTDPS